MDRSMAAANPATPGAEDSCFPAWMILDDEAYIEDHDNATTAAGETSSGLRVKVTFLAADPPRLSRFCVHCPRGSNESALRLSGRPSILQTAGSLALISIAHGWGCSPAEYFFYRAAGRGRPPRIEPLPTEIESYLQDRTRAVVSVGFLPRGGGGGGYVVAALVSVLGNGQNDRELHVFRSERGTWTTSVLAHGRHKLTKVEKVIAMGDGKLGFVDLLKGILVCDVLSDNPTGRFIPLPKLLPGNQPSDNGDGLTCLTLARPFRDVAVYADGLIKCVEEEPIARLTIHKVPRVTKRRIVPEKLPDDVSNTDEIHDSDLMPDPVDVEEVDMEEEETYQYLGWRVIAWSRTASSICWRKECLIHVDDIVANHNPTHDALLSEFGGSKDPDLTLKDLRVSYPSLSMDDSNALYLTTKKVKQSRDQEEVCVIKVDMGKKTLEEVSPVLAERERYNLSYISCSLSKYWNTDSDAGTQIGEQNADSCTSSSTLQSTQGSGNQLVRVVGTRPPYGDRLIQVSSKARPPSVLFYSDCCSPLNPHPGYTHAFAPAATTSCGHPLLPSFGNHGYNQMMRPPPPAPPTAAHSSWPRPPTPPIVARPSFGNRGYNQLMRPPPLVPPTVARPPWPRLPPPPPTAACTLWPLPPPQSGNQNIGKD